MHVVSFAHPTLSFSIAVLKPQYQVRTSSPHGKCVLFCPQDYIVELSVSSRQNVALNITFDTLPIVSGLRSLTCFY